MKQFWNWARDADENRVLYLDGAIAEESWLEDDVTPAAFKAELMAGNGPITIWMNSPGGDCVAASQIYTMLMEYPHDVTIKIDGIAASAASVIAMSGTRVLMSPTSLMMVHNPLVFALGDTEEMRKAIQLLDEVKESIINAYQIRTGLSRTKLSNLMDAETWMSAGKAIELGFVDALLFADDPESKKKHHPCGLDDGFTFSRRAVTNSLLDKLHLNLPIPRGIPIQTLYDQLNARPH